MNQLPFSVYDFFGYLACGAVVLAALIASFFGDASFQTSPTLPVGFLLVIIVYVLGQIVANVAGDLIERRIVRERFGTPTEVLMGSRTPSKYEARFFPGYFRALPLGVQTRVRARAGDRKGDDLFLHCHAQMKPNPVVQARLDTFLNLYGFCRNTAMGTLFASACLLSIVLWQRRNRIGRRAGMVAISRGARGLGTLLSLPQVLPAVRLRVVHQLRRGGAQMSTVKSFATGEGDTYYIQHGSDNFTIIDCRMAEDRDDILEELKDQSAEKGITRFISTHPDDDHIRGLAPSR